ncbi:chitinase [Enterococcus sp. DIV2402]|uniref:Chitinase n=1 Tax=Candidatus Enterococcus lowellii TaxID=2230877 RepID=A0ABZ2SRL0_9ENTE|nr:carbohydrate-binding protein [Enterococcus sp. DIV2402]MBO0462936.1 chitinase [Enterococcus sp. DIV2402]
MKNKQVTPTRRLSILRLLFMVVVLLIGSGAYLNRTELFAQFQKSDHQPWFASYVDVTATPQFNFEQLEDNVVLSFVVASEKDGSPSWGNFYSLEEASQNLDLDRRIARLRQKGYDVIVSFGGLLNDELALRYTDVDSLVAAYQEVIDRYDLTTIDLDLENDGLTNRTVNQLRAQAIAKLQTNRKKAGKSLAVWLTLPADPNGLTKDGTDTVAEFLTNKVDLAGVNIMTMNYGGSRQPKLSLAENAIQALKETHRQLKIMYNKAGIYLSDAVLWAKIGATPMIGQNDVATERFTLKDATELNQFAQKVKLGRMSMWSANRDRKSNPDYVPATFVSDSYSGVTQEDQDFAKRLKKNLNGKVAENAQLTTVSNLTKEELQKPDDPATSPYPIWSEEGVYLAQTKVVWHHHVYEAKWWTKGDAPDSPILRAEETPWQLIGPVLPGEKPLPQLKLPEGTYPNWLEDTVYTAGKRVMFDGIGYEAKWWNKNENPEKALINFETSPWKALSQKEIKQMIQAE